jgi:hypothetical protein
MKGRNEKFVLAFHKLTLRTHSHENASMPHWQHTYPISHMTHFQITKGL